MKFSLKQLILFVTVAAIICGISGFFYTQVLVSHQRALDAMQVAMAERERAEKQAEMSTLAFEELTAQLAAVDAAATNKQEFEYSILHWTIESGGNDPATIASHLIELGQFDIIGLSKVSDPEPYVNAITTEWPDDYDFLRGNTGIYNGREDDRMLLCINNTKFLLIEFADMEEAGGVKLNDGHHRAPLYARLKDRSNGQELIVILSHLARDDAEFRAQQAGALREWARNKSTPMIAIGDYNFEYDFNTQKGNAGFDDFLKDGVWKWIKPVEMIDTNWSDDNGVDRYPDSMLEFNFVAGAAKDWKTECRVIVHEVDFPDDKRTSDHRPVELILKR